MVNSTVLKPNICIVTQRCEVAGLSAEGLDHEMYQYGAVVGGLFVKRLNVFDDGVDVRGGRTSDERFDGVHDGNLNNRVTKHLVDWSGEVLVRIVEVDSVGDI